jgi:sterol desaturase/sphingolipid hydroxylase (fatty acid hydroxylase superfamily)
MLLLGVTVLIFVLFEAFVWSAHKLLHCRWTGPLWRSHHLHHQLYNPRHPASDEYRPVGWRSAQYRILVLAVCLAISLLFFPLWLAAWIMAEIFFLAFFTEFIHDATHTMGHWLERYGWYRRVRLDHWIHHANSKKNFGILTLYFDRLTNTYKRG